MEHEPTNTTKDIPHHLAIPAYTLPVLDAFQTVGIYHQTTPNDQEALAFITQLACRRAILVNAQSEFHALELGTWCGQSALAIAAGIIHFAQSVPHLEFVARLSVIDHFQGTDSDQNGLGKSIWGGSSKPYAIDNLSQLPHQQIAENVLFRVNIIQSYSAPPDSEPCPLPKNCRPLDLLYVDADHTDPGCTNDILYWAPYVKPNAIIAGHDYGTQFPGVIAAVDRCAAHLTKTRPLLVPCTATWHFRMPPHPEEPQNQPQCYQM